jgi:hypothetical protein
MIRPRLPAVLPAPKRRAEQDWAPWLRRTRPSLRASARNLVHYWALQRDLQDLQQTCPPTDCEWRRPGCAPPTSTLRGGWPVKPKFPLIPGHEGVGIVEEVGPTEVSGIAVGDRVAVARGRRHSWAGRTR